MKIQLSIFGIFLVSLCKLLAQVVDSFDNAEINNTIWKGNVSQFQVVDNMLRSNGPNAANQKIYLYTPNQLVDSTEWNFLIDLRFNPTSTTLVRVYLVCNNPDLTQAQNGYYIQYGETNQDFLRFYRQTGTTSTLLFTGTESFSGNIRTRIKVLRDKEGNWEFLSDRTGGNSFKSEGKVTENTHKTSQFFGFLCEYATASRYNLYNFDDVLVRNIVKDTVKPTIVRVSALDATTISVKFSEFVSKSSAENLSNYQLNGFTLSQALRGNTDSSEVTLTIAEPLSNPNSYSLVVNNIFDLAGNSIRPNSQSEFVFFTPFAKCLLINELMPDPDPVVGLPNAEFIELYNPQDFPINLDSWKLSKGVSDVNLPNSTIPAKGYLILSGTGNASQFSAYGTTLGVPSIPALVNTGDKIQLKSNTGLLIDEVNYRDTWYRNTTKRNGGWSLELINPESPCSGASNWTASNDPSGGTPGRQNSVYDLTPDINPPSLISYSLKGRDSLLVVYSEPLDTIVVKNTSLYNLNEGSINRVAMESDFSRWWVILAQPILQGRIYQMTISGMKDCSGNTQTNPISFSFGLGKAASVGDVLITEIMADESPVVGLPEAEFIEIWNRTDQVLSLADCYLNDGGTSRARFPQGAILLPNEYAVVCGPTRGDLFASYGKVFALSSFPALTNSGKTLFLRSPSDELIFQVSYSDNWYNDNVKKDGGWTLEMINPNQNCLGGVNWTASVDPSGGTPGRINSVNSAAGYRQKLVVSNTFLTNDSTLLIAFSQNIDLTTATTQGNILANMQSPKSITANPNTLTLAIDKVEPGKSYPLNIMGLKDCVGNSMDNFTGNYGIGRSPDRYEVLITEVMADESPTVGLPEAEFVEIYNTTQEVISLSGLSLTDGRSVANFPAEAILLPKEYAIVTSSTRAALFAPYGKTFGLSGFPTLSNSGKLIYLNSRTSGMIHAVNYSDTWYGSASKKEGGWTLEMVDLTNPCAGVSNWTASVSPTGGTPARINSVTGQNPDLTPPSLVLTFALNDSTLILRSDEPLDSFSIVNSRYIFEDNPLNISSVSTVGPFYQEINIKVEPKLLPKKVYTLAIEGLKDCAGNVKPIKTYTLNLTEQSEKGDILLNEVLFDPRTGGNDFVEIYNASDKFINLAGWSLARLREGLIDSKYIITTENYIIKPRNYLAITDNVQNIKNNYPRSPDSSLFQAERLPAYLADSSTILLFDNLDTLVQIFHYNKRFHHPMVDNVQGVSLERVSFSLPENLRENWHSAAASVGYATPGLPNSQRRNHSLELANHFEVTPRVITPDNDGWDDFAFLNYKLDQTGFMGTIQIIDSRGRIVKHILKNELMGTEGIYKWDGSDDSGQKSPIGYYLFHIEVFRLDGTTEIIRKPVAVYFGNH